jgi:sec-independent protein translocase protein TatB
MPGFEDSAVIVLLALLLFGPKKLPELARQLGKLMADFRRASSEFRSQMEDELRVAEQAERQKKLAATSAESPEASSVAPPVVVPALDPTQAEAVEAAYANQDLPPLEASNEAAPQTSLDTAIEPMSEAAQDSIADSAPETDFKTSAEFAQAPIAPTPAISAEHDARPKSPSESSAEVPAPAIHAAESERVPEVLHG